MAEKSPRRLMLESSLAEDPADTFLRYGLAVQCLREGDVEEGRQRLLALIHQPAQDRQRISRPAISDRLEDLERVGRPAATDKSVHVLTRN